MNYDFDPDVLEGIRGLLTAIGEDPNREGLLDTPKRVLKAWRELTSGYVVNPAELLSTVFELDDVEEAEGTEKYDQMIVSRDLPFNSNCEHHMMPFWGEVHIGYIPADGRVVGLSKLARVVDVYANRLQVQERMTQQIALSILDHLKPLGVGVVVTGTHSCQRFRGVRKPGVMTTSAMFGEFRDDPIVRAEFLELIRK